MDIECATINSGILNIRGRLAQRLAQVLYTHKAGGSNPSSPTTVFEELPAMGALLVWIRSGGGFEPVRVRMCDSKKCPCLGPFRPIPGRFHEMHGEPAPTARAIPRFARGLAWNKESPGDSKKRPGISPDIPSDGARPHVCPATRQIRPPKAANLPSTGTNGGTEASTPELAAGSRSAHRHLPSGRSAAAGSAAYAGRSR